MAYPCPTSRSTGETSQAPAAGELVAGRAGRSARRWRISTAPAPAAEVLRAQVPPEVQQQMASGSYTMVADWRGPGDGNRHRPGRCDLRPQELSLDGTQLESCGRSGNNRALRGTASLRTVLQRSPPMIATFHRGGDWPPPLIGSCTALSRQTRGPGSRSARLTRPMQPGGPG